MDRYRVTPAFSTTLSPRDPVTTSFSISTKPSHLQLQAPPPISSCLRSSTRRTYDSAELSIFGAERYFRDSNASFDERCIDIHSINPRDSSVSSADGFGPRNCRTRSLNGTPTASSEASWNSQSGLLSNPAVRVKSSPTREQSKKSQPGTRRRLFGRYCPCIGKKSVTVDDVIVEPKSPMSSFQQELEVTNSSFREKIKPNIQAEEAISDFTTTIQISPPKVVTNTELEDMESEMTKVKITPGGNNWPKGEMFLTKTPLFSPKQPSIPIFPAEIGHRVVSSSNFSFPVMNPKTNSEDLPRESLEVFQPKKPRAALNTSSSTARRSFNYTSLLPPAILEEEARSDASSDLFELESFATSSYQTSYNRRRDSLDDEMATEVAPSEYGVYPPSEASVVWSVTTAEGFDPAGAANFSSAASDYYSGDEFRFMQAEHDRFAAALTRRDELAGPKKPGGGGLLNSCRCDKAVSVGPNPVRVESVREAEAGLVKLAGSGKRARVYLPVRA